MLLILRDENARADQAQYIGDFLRRAGRIDAAGDRPDKGRSQISQQIFDADVAHDGDTRAWRKPAYKQAGRNGADLVTILLPGQLAEGSVALVTERDRVRRLIDTRCHQAGNCCRLELLQSVLQLRK